MQLQHAKVFNEAAVQWFPCRLCFLLAKSSPSPTPLFFLFAWFFYLFVCFNPSRNLCRGEAFLALMVEPRDVIWPLPQLSK